METVCDAEEGDGVKVLRSRSLQSPFDSAPDDLVWTVFLELCCPAFLKCCPLGNLELCAPLRASAPQIAICFMTSARALAPTSGSRPLWNDAAWMWLAKDFEKRQETPFDDAFRILWHDDTSETPTDFLKRGRRVPSVSTERASLSLVLAELQLLRAAVEAGVEAALLVSGSCLPLVSFSVLQSCILQLDKSVLQYHFMRGGQQRALGVPYGALQWKVWRRRELEILASLSEEDLCRRWLPLEDAMRRNNLAPDEVVFVNELHERVGVDGCCDRRAVTYTEWMDRAPDEEGPVRARSFQFVPEAAWQARSAGALLCRKVVLDEPALSEWCQRLAGEVEKHSVDT